MSGPPRQGSATDPDDAGGNGICRTNQRPGPDACGLFPISLFAVTAQLYPFVPFRLLQEIGSIVTGGQPSVSRQPSTFGQHQIPPVESFGSSTSSSGAEWEGDGSFGQLGPEFGGFPEEHQRTGPRSRRSAIADDGIQKADSIRRAYWNAEASETAVEKEQDLEPKRAKVEGDQQKTRSRRSAILEEGIQKAGSTIPADWTAEASETAVEREQDPGPKRAKVEEDELISAKDVVDLASEEAEEEADDSPETSLADEPKRGAPKVSCRKCGLRLLSKNKTRHVSTAHLRVACFQCLHCQYKLSEWFPSRLRSHIQATHKIPQPMDGSDFKVAESR